MSRNPQTTAKSSVPTVQGPSIVPLASQAIELDDLRVSHGHSTSASGSERAPVATVTSSAQLSIEPLNLDLDEATTRRREEEAVALHPVDGGFHAWLFVFCSFVLEMLFYKG